MSERRNRGRPATRGRRDPAVNWQWVSKPPRTLIVVYCTALHICFGTVYAWSYFQTILVRQYGWSYTETALAISTAFFSIGMSAAWAGNVLPRVGPRRMALAGSLLFAVGYVIAGLALRMELVPLFVLGFGVIGGMGIGLGYGTPVTTAVKWFPDQKGRVSGIVVMGFGLGALLMSKGLAPYLIAMAEGDLSLVFVGLGIVFACVMVPCSLALSNPPGSESVADRPLGAVAGPAPETTKPYLMSVQFVLMWVVFFFNIAAGISVISFQSELLQEVWGLADPTVEPATLAEYGATLIAVSSLCNGGGRLLWGSLSDRIGRVKVFRILLASQMVVFGVLMTESNPWVFSVLVCYVLLCFGGGFATMPPFILGVFGSRRMSTIYGAILTAWAMAGICGPVYVGFLKDQYPDRAVMYCFLIGIFMLGAGYLFSYLLNDDRMRVGRPTVDTTLREFGIPAAGKA